MDFLQFDVGIIDSHAIVQVALESQARVLLLDAANFSAFSRGAAWEGQGGWAVRSPVNLRPTHSCHWTVVVDLNGAAGQVRANVQVLRGMAA